MNKKSKINTTPGFATFVDVLQKRIEDNGERKAFTFISNSGNDIYTFEQLGNRVKRLSALLQKLNLSGERALLLYPPGMEYIIGYFACLYAGVIAVPVYPPDPSRLKKTLPRLQAIAKDAKAKVALSTQSIVDDVNNWEVMLSGKGNNENNQIEKIKIHSEEFADLFNLKWIATDNIKEELEHEWIYPAINSNSIAYLQYTSGSTGTPKGVMINHQNLLHNTDMILNGFGLDYNEFEGVIWLPIYHDMGLIGGILEPVFSGFHCTLLSPVDFLKRPLRWLQIISDKKDKAIVSGGPNFAYDLCLRASTPQKREALDLSNWKVAFSGAEPVRAETINEFSKAFAIAGFKKNAFYPCYGLAEGTLIVSGGTQEEEPVQLTIDKEELKKDKVVQVNENHPRKIDFVSSGREILDGIIRIVNPETKQVCKEGIIGEVWSKSKSNAQGYWEKPQLSEETFNAFTSDTNEGPFLRTGDLGFIKNGELFITGRLKDLIIIRGSNHYPQDIELTVEKSNKLLRPGSVAAFSADINGEEQLVIVQEARAKKNVDWEKVISDIKNAVFDVHNIVPYAIVLIKPKTIFKTSSGKIRRKDTKKAYLNNELEIVYDSRLTLESELTEHLQTEEIVKQNVVTEEIKKYQKLLAEKIAGLKNTNVTEIDIKQPFAEFGIDSAKAVGLVGELEETLDITLPATLLWDYPTIEKLSEFLSGSKAKILNDDKTTKITKEEIAVIGIGCKFPDAENPREYWDLLINGKDAIHEVPKERWDVDEFYNRNESKPGKMNTKWGGFIKDVDKFDPAFFGISPRETIQMDPQQRLLLETTWQAFENSGIIPDEIMGSKTGVFVGIGNHDYSQFNVGNIESLTSYTGTGNALCIAANRISYLFDFNGPSIAVDTACSSSLVAVHLAVKSLQNRESSVAVAGGVNLILTPDVNIALSQAQMMSPDGKCKTFDESANGYVRSEGCGIVILKRLSDAQKDGDNILAVIKGSAVNQDGRSNGLTAPNRHSQVNVIQSALSDANVSPSDISFIETHGTGTSLGDPIEVQALTDVFNGNERNNKIILGAVKSNIGHLETAAGIAGLIKVVLSLNNKFIPKNINFNSINPLIPIEKIPFKIPTENIEWKTTSRKRVAGVSSFGFGGTNAHVILEEPPEPQITVNEYERPLNILTISAKDNTALKNYILAHKKYLTNNPEVNLYDYCHTANTCRTHFEKRTALVFKEREELLDKLIAEKENNEVNKKIKTAFLFTGQGSQYVNMGKELYQTQPVFKKEFDKCNEILNNYLAIPLYDVIFPKDGTSAEIHNTEYTQPALFAIEYAIAKLWQSFGVEPDYMIGHSVGEYVAAVIGGVMSLEDGLKLIATRGRLMQALPQNGKMAVIFTGELDVQKVIENYKSKVSIAGINGPDNIVISGEGKAVEKIVKSFEDKNIQATFLKVSHAFHSHLMQPILNEFEKIATEIKFNKTKIPFISNLTGKLIEQNEMLDAKYWKEHIRKAVQFNKGMKELEKLNVNTFIEVGPHPVLLGMGQICLPDIKAIWLPSLQRKKNDWEVLLNSLAVLYKSGYKIDWKGYDKAYNRKQIFIPTYPFNKERYWLENSTVGKRKVASNSKNINDFDHPLLHRKVTSPFIEKIIFETRLNEKDLSIIKDHKIFGSSLLPATAYAELVSIAFQKAFGGSAYQLEGLTITEGIVFKNNIDKIIQIAFDSLENNKASFQIFSREKNKENWTFNANGSVSVSENGFQKIKITKEEIIEKSKKFSEEELELFYASMKEHGFEYGKSMRLIKELWHSGNEAIGYFKLPENDNEAQSYLIHPALTDAGTQLFASMISSHSNVSVQNGIYLPMEMQNFKIFKIGISEVWGYVKQTEKNTNEKELQSNLILFDENGETVAEIENIKYKFTTFEALAKILMRDLDNWIYKTSWINKNLNSSDMPLKGTYLVFEDKLQTYVKLKNEMEAKGGKVIIARNAKSFSKIDDNEYELDTDNEDDMKMLFGLLHESENDLNGIIYLPTLDYEFNDERDTTPFNKIHKKVLNGIIVLLQKVALTGFVNPPEIFIVTKNAQATGITKEKPNLALSLLHGFVNTVNLEMPEIKLKLVDFENKNTANIARKIIDEITTGNDETQTAYRNNKRLVARIRNVKSDGELHNTALPQRLEIHKKGILDNLELVPLARTKPKKGEVEIRVYATGLNFRDVLNALDLYPGDPGLLGGECAGVVTAVGEDVDEFEIGNEVLGVASGSFATHVITDKNLLVHKPDNISFEEAASIPIVYLTAYYTLHKLAKLQKGETVLIHAATGGVGLAAIQIAKMLGAKIFGTAGNDEKRSVLKEEGVELIMNSRSLHFADEIMKYTNGKGVDVILNSFSGKYIEKGLSVLSEKGRFLEIGKRGIWNKEQVENFRNDIEYYTIAIDDISQNNPEAIKEMLLDIIKEFENGVLTPIRNEIFPLKDAVQAFRYMRRAKHIGKIVLTQNIKTENNETLTNVNIIPEATYLITGGRGALGLLTAKWLVKKGAVNLILTGRNKPDKVTEEKIKELTKLGAKVFTPLVDVADYMQMKKMFEEYCEKDSKLPPLRGIVHAAGTLDDGILLQQNWDRFENVFKPKVQGAWNLHMLTEKQQLDFMIYFSSVASMFGSPGQSNYATANSFMDSLAFYRRAIDKPAQSINWGPWDSYGMAADTIVKNNGINKLSVSQGLYLLEKLFEAGYPQAAAVSINTEIFAEQLKENGNPPLFDDFYYEENNKSQNENKTPELIEKLESADADVRAEIVKSFLSDKIKTVLGMNGTEKINTAKPLSEMGIDSLMGLEIKKIIDNAIGKNLPATMVFNYPTIDSLADYLLSDVLNLTEKDTEKKNSDDKPEVTEDYEATQNIENLTDEEVEAILLKKLDGENFDELKDDNEQ